MTLLKATGSTPMKPTKFAEHVLITKIIEGEYQPGMLLPAERELAVQLGVTRPTLRETLQRLAAEGWVTIRHGKPTMVNDYWAEGGMGLLSTLSRYAEYLPENMVVPFLEVRSVIIPKVAAMACEKGAEEIIRYLDAAPGLGSDAGAFVAYDWGLQVRMASASGNPLFRMMLNDFKTMYEVMGERYFSVKSCKKLSLAYYKELSCALSRGDSGNVELLVKGAMDESSEIWVALPGNQN